MVLKLQCLPLIPQLSKRAYETTIKEASSDTNKAQMVYCATNATKAAKIVKARFEEILHNS